MKIPNHIDEVWIQRMTEEVDFFSRVENGRIVIRLYKRT
jgi:hypothetical protein